ncbi:MAG: InlB B-repeat-containing protein, partial [Oribacterium sp.]|nr:InlB B-repeat-containing protein [Oribacterium sp.]
MKNTKKFTMRTIAATLAALSMMSTITMTAGAIQDTTAAPQTDTVVAETTETPAADPAGTGETPAPEENADTTTAEEKPFVRVEANASSECDTSEAATLYTITFDTDGGTPISPISAPAGATVTLPEDPVKEGFAFIGWDTEIPEFMPESDLIVKAKWEPNKYTIITDHSETTVYHVREEMIADKEKNGLMSADYAAVNVAGMVNNFSAFDTVGSSANDFSISDETVKTLGTIGNDMVNEGFATVSKLVPGSGILLSPFKVLFNKATKSDPMSAMNEKLDNIENKVDGISTKLSELSTTYQKNTEWIGKKVDNTSDMSNVRTSFQSLDRNIRNLNKAVIGVETNSHLKNNYEKVFMIAQLGTKETYTKVSDDVYSIQKSLNKPGAQYVSFYDTLYNNKALYRMLSVEAYRDSKPIVDELLTEYLCAVALMQEIETARQAVANFTEKDIAQLSPKIKELYDDYVLFDESTQAQNEGDPGDALVACVNGYIQYVKDYDNTDFIDYAHCRKPFKFEVRYLDFKVDPETVTYSSDVPLMEIHKRLTKDEIKDLLEYHPDG